MIVPLWAKAAIGAVLLVGAYAAGDSAGANRVLVRHAKVLEKSTAAGARLLAAAQLVDQRAAARDEVRRAQVREIYREVPTVIDRPVYRSVCVDGDGVRLLDRAVAAANGDAGPAGGAAGDAGPIRDAADPH